MKQLSFIELDTDQQDEKGRAADGISRTRNRQCHHPYDHHNTDQLDHGLSVLYGAQERISSLVPNCIPEPGELATPDQVATYGYALIKEITETLDELGWKPWKDAKPADPERVADEVADILAFLGVLLIYVERNTGLTMKDIAEAYERKSEVNIQRLTGQVDGYRKNGRRRPPTNFQ